MIIPKHIFGGQNSFNGNLHGIQKKICSNKTNDLHDLFWPKQSILCQLSKQIQFFSSLTIIILFAKYLCPRC